MSMGMGLCLVAIGRLRLVQGAMADTNHPFLRLRPDSRRLALGTRHTMQRAYS